VRTAGVQRRTARPAAGARSRAAFITDAELSARLTATKRTPERAWLAEVSAVVLQQALADRFVPTSQTCSACGARDGPKPLHVRTWQCRGCGAWLDRDINAAVNVAKAAGLAVTACRAQVRPGPVPAQRGEAGTHPISRWEVA